MKWTIVSGIVNDSLMMSVRNLGYSRNAGEFVRKYFADIGSAGGHRVDGEGRRPAARVPGQVRQPAGRQFTDLVLKLALEFLHEHQPPDKRLVGKREGRT